MRQARAASLVILAGVAPALADIQTQGSVTWTLSAQEYGMGAGPGWTNPVAGGNGNGIIEPGEGVLFTFSISMSGTPAAGGLGSPLTWSTGIHNLPPNSGAGTLAGLWGGDVDLVGDGGALSASGTWSDRSTNYGLAVRRRLLAFTTLSEIGYVNGSHTGTGPASRVTDIQPANGPFDAEQIDHSNNIPVWSGLWIPVDFTARTVNWSVTIGSLGILSSVAARDQGYDTGSFYPIPLNVQTLFAGSTSVQVVPAPAGLTLLGAGLLGVRRRRR
jgi:MYXO-CTERM domain-containing protein